MKTKRIDITSEELVIVNSVDGVIRLLRETEAALRNDNHVMGPVRVRNYGGFEVIAQVEEEPSDS